MIHILFFAIKKGSAKLANPLISLGGVLAAYLGHSEYKHTAKYLKLLDAEHRHHLVNFISTQRHNP
jgi:hypothetical protein